MNINLSAPASHLKIGPVSSRSTPLPAATDETDQATEARASGGPAWIRLLFVLSSMSPLFILWAIRGTSVMPERGFWVLCGALCLIPNLALWAYIARAQRRKIVRTLTVVHADDRRQDVITYLFAMLLPFYTVDMSSWRNVAATITAFAIVMILFLKLDLYYLNLIGVVFGYHCLQVTTPEPTHGGAARKELDAPSYMVITKRPSVRSGTQLTVLQLAGTIVLERG